MNLNPDHLITFARVAQVGSLSRAAAVLNLSQPAVSTQMRQLSDAVGEPLFNRHRLGVSLTPAGMQLLPYAQAVARALEGAGAVALRLQGMEMGSVRVAASTTIASYLLPSAIARFRLAHPGLEITQFVGNTREVVGRLEAGEADLALVEGPVEHLPPGVERQVIRHDEIVLVTLPGHPLSGSIREPQELEGLEVVWREEGSGTRAFAERAVSGVRLNPVLELVGSEAVKEAVIEGLGSTFLSRLVVYREVRAGLLAETKVNSPALIRPLTLLRAPLDLLPRAGRAFLQVLEQQPEV